MRIDLNVARINRAQGFDLVPPPRRRLEGLIWWMKLGLFVLTLPHFILASRTALWLIPTGLVLPLTLVVASKVVVSPARRRMQEPQAEHPKRITRDHNPHMRVDIVSAARRLITG